MTRLLGRAPVGLALLALALFATRWLLSGRLDLAPVGLVLIAYYVAHALLANLNDVMPSFAGTFVVSMLPIAAGLVCFWRVVDGRGPLGWQSGVLVCLFLVAYPLMSLSEDYGGTLAHIMYSLLVMYVLALVARRVVQGRSASEAAA